ADRASLLTALVVRAVREFDIDLGEFHQDTTTVSFAGAYAAQAPAAQADRPPRITFGYNKDHRPDLKQLLYSITISADGAVPVHSKTYDGNTTDDQVHQRSCGRSSGTPTSCTWPTANSARARTWASLPPGKGGSSPSCRGRAPR